jgi:hypothetical protein
MTKNSLLIAHSYESSSYGKGSPGVTAWFNPKITAVPGIRWFGRLEISGKIVFSKKFVLSCLTRKD